MANKAKSADHLLTTVWQPIETAPKDGRDVLLGWRFGSRWMVVGAHYTPDKSGHDNRPTGGGSWYVTKGNGKTVWLDREVFWMPLPAPPAILSEIERLKGEKV